MFKTRIRSSSGITTASGLTQESDSDSVIFETELEELIDLTLEDIQLGTESRNNL